MIEQDKGLKLPKRLQADFSRHVQALADGTSRELERRRHLGRFRSAPICRRTATVSCCAITRRPAASGDRLFVGRVAVGGAERSISGRGNGLISGVIVAALGESTGPALDVVDY